MERLYLSITRIGFEITEIAHHSRLVSTHQ